MSINLKLTAFVVIMIILPALILGIVGYKAAEKAIYAGVNDRLRDQSNDWRIIAKAYEQEIQAQQLRVRNSAKSIVEAQSKSTYEIIDKAIKDNNGKLTDSSREDVLKRLNRNTVGKSGYIWVLDYKGTYILSKGRQRDGENIWETKDADGKLIIQDLISTGRAATGSDITYLSYMWLNNGETIPREKIAAMLNFPELGWVVGISTYYDDLVDMNYRERSIEHAKEMISQQAIGNSGYIWVVDSNGKYVVSKNRARDGEDIGQSRDADGVLFIQEAIKKAKAAGAGTDYQVYPWKNAGEKNSRMKVAGLTYVPEWDWVIGVSAYYDDFQGAGSLGLVKSTLSFVTLIAVIIGALLALIFALKITRPLTRMSVAGKKIIDGEPGVEIPDIQTGDEIEDLSLTVSTLANALKYLREEKKGKK